MTTEKERRVGAHTVLASQAFGVLEGVLDQQLRRQTGGARFGMVRVTVCLLSHGG